MSRRRRTKSRSGRRQRILIRALVLFLLFFILDVAMENRDLYEPDGTSCEVISSDATPPFYERVYPFLTEHLLKAPSGRVKAVYIPEDLVEVQQDLCQGRAHIAALVHVVALQRPAAIVLDKYFSERTCKSNPTQEGDTAFLLGAIKEARSTGVPVIVGEATKAPDKETLGTCLLDTNDHLAFGPNGLEVPRGLTKLNSNREQIPLQWPVLNVPRTQAIETDSLALKTAKILAAKAVPPFDPSVASHGARQPYGNLRIAEAVPSTELLATHGTSSTEFKDKVVVIGSQNAVDRWIVLGKPRWGYELQAAYIDALISDNYLKAVSAKWIVALSILFIVFLEAVPIVCDAARRLPRWHHSKHLESVSEFWVVLWPLLFVAVVSAVCLGWRFFPPLSVLIAALITMMARGIFTLMDHYGKNLIPPLKETE